MEPMDVEIEVVGVPKHAWLIWLAMGVLGVGLGIWLLLSPDAAIATIALLLAIAMFLNGFAELVTAGSRSRPWIGYLLGALFLVAGLVVLIRPDKSLRFLAVFVGLSIIVTGLVELAVAFADREHLRHWAWLAAAGAVGVVIGVLAVVWPGVTITVLALLIGIRLLIWGAIQLLIAFQLRSLTS